MQLTKYTCNRTFPLCFLVCCVCFVYNVQFFRSVLHGYDPARSSLVWMISPRRYKLLKCFVVQHRLTRRVTIKTNRNLTLILFVNSERKPERGKNQDYWNTTGMTKYCYLGSRRNRGNFLMLEFFHVNFTTGLCMILHKYSRHVTQKWIWVLWCINSL